MKRIAEAVIASFLTMEERHIRKAFGDMEGAVMGKRFVYVPGDEEDFRKRILLVGHMDTVRRSHLTFDNLWWSDGIFMSTDSDCLGADDRAGLAMLWMLAADDRRHSLLITDEEETGCRGADDAVHSLFGELMSHAFAIEVDRRGSEEMVFYNGTENQEFKDWLGEVFPKWDQGYGSVTDISVICPEVGICGVNLAAGYYNQHTHTESLKVADWFKTYELLKKVVEMEEYPIFDKPDPRIRLLGKGSASASGLGWEWGDDDADDSEWWRDSEVYRKYLRERYGYAMTDDGDDEEDDDQDLPIINAAGDVIGYVPAKEVSDEARADGYVFSEDYKEGHQGDAPSTLMD